MGQGTHTALITKVVIGKIHHSKDLMATISFKMENSTCSLYFSMDDISEMMDKTKCYEDVNQLIGRPCEIEIDDKNACHFKSIWKWDD